VAATPHDGAGTVFNMAGTVFTVTNLVLANNNPTADQELIDVAHLGQTTGAQAARLTPPLLVPAGNDTGRQVTFDYLGRTYILDGQTGTVTITVAGTAIITSRAFTVQSSTLTLATNDAIRGNAVLSIARS